ncbi:TetR/AcrR family transcriptional regulator [Winogradskya consettensis]|uniref:TetR/AcrR family transcriptional regulator n=1 Tax=Winogradskya consettensis TaxID=113560 RepID=UPI001BB39B66|nr:TetR/AcrR family transcriptional regulator [Actinoplanes consettensis]
MSAASPAVRKQSARDRLLAAADELFYAEGVHTVGIDRVIEQAGVAKASLYSCFGNKDGLIRAYLQGRHESRQKRILTGLERFDTPRDRLVGVFDVLIDYVSAPAYRGCAFYNASAESEKGGVAEEMSDANRAWTQELLVGLAREAGAPDPATLAAQLVILYDGASAGARLDRHPEAAVTARAMAAILVDAAITAL